MEPSGVFSIHSFWNTPVPADAPIPADSDHLVAALVHEIQTHYGTVNINTVTFSVPVYVVDPGVAEVKVAVRTCGQFHALPEVAKALQGVPIPAGALPAAGTDHDLVIWQPSSDTEWEMWRAVDGPEGWSACSGGRFDHVSTASGIFPSPTGVAASGLSLLGGLIRYADLRKGQIDHVLSVAIPDTLRYPAFVAPADRTDGYSTSADAIAEGTHFRLDPSLDVSKLGLDPLGLMIARALQTYGMVVADTAGGVTLQAQDPSPGLVSGQLDPWALAFGSQASYEVLAKIPWERMQVVRPTH